MKRRDFLQLGAAGIIIACRMDPLRAFQGRGTAPRLDYPTDFNAYLRIGADGRVTGYVGKIEMGQGSQTALGQLVAEELGVPLDTVDLVMGDTDLCPWDLGTFGSMGIAIFGPVLRRAAAEARQVLRELAAERLQLPVDTLIAKDGVIQDIHHPDRRITYASLAAGRSIARRASGPIALKDRSTFTSIGRSPVRRDISKVTGAAIYAGDVRLPGMLYATMLRPPAHDATRVGVDTIAARGVAGAIIVQDGDLVAALHERPDEAARAAALMVGTFDFRALPLDHDNIFEHLIAAAPPAQRVASSGTIEGGERLASAIFDQTYFNGYVAHAPMETHTALAQLANGRFTIWASTQAPFMVQTQVAAALDVPPDRVRIITPFVGGGFGGKTLAPQAVEAARLARATGRPVQVAWDRAEEFFYDTFRPAAVVKLRTGIDHTGRIVLWTAAVYGAGEGGALPFYDIPHQQVDVYGGWQNPTPGMHPFGVGAWRAPAFNTNAFAREQQIDLMAAGASLDPVAFRLRNLSDARMRRVLQTAADRFGWPGSRARGREGVGIACGVYSNTCVATVAEVQVEAATGEVRVSRLVCAQDMGQVVNPDGARMQVEGALTMGLGYALSEELHFSHGRIADRHFGSYQIPRFSTLPTIETVLVDAPDLPAFAGGEPPIICVGAALANAISDATGVRLLRLPMTPARVKAALDRKS